MKNESVKQNYVFAIVGLCGSGKSEASAIFQKRGSSLIRVDDEILDELKKKKFKVTELSRKQMRDELRVLYGKDALVSLLFDKIDVLLQEKSVVLDGMYSWDEYISLRKKYADTLKVISIFCSKDLRYSRLEKRKDRSLTRKISEERDFSEIEHLNKGGPIAMADFTIINDKATDALEKEIVRILKILNVQTR